MKCMEICKTKEASQDFIEELKNNGYDMDAVECEETYEPNDDIPEEEYERNKEDYHCFVVWYNPKPLRK